MRLGPSWPWVLAASLIACGRSPVGGSAIPVSTDGISTADAGSKPGGGGGGGGSGKTDAGKPVELKANGEPCVHDKECEGGTCLEDPQFPGGFCTRAGCQGDFDCGRGMRCIKTDNETFCAPACDGDRGCRDGYQCVGITDDARVCWPEDLATHRADGEPCHAEEQCGGRTCIFEWPGGYCTTTGCRGNFDCNSIDGAESRCIFRRGEPSICLRGCNTREDCRDGYACVRVSRETFACVPQEG